MTTPRERLRSTPTHKPSLRTLLGATLACTAALVVVAAPLAQAQGVVPVGTGTPSATAVPVAVGTPKAGASQAAVTGTGVVGAKASLEPIPTPIPPGTWVCPVPSAKFRNDWGESRSGGRRHEGTDMMAPIGTPIVAPIAGTVRFDESGRGGRQFWLRTDDGLTVYGAHLSSYGTPGRVDAGTFVGTVGDTGNATGTPHLHLEVHPAKNQKINPFQLLDSIC